MLRHKRTLSGAWQVPPKNTGSRYVTVIGYASVLGDVGFVWSDSGSLHFDGPRSSFRETTRREPNVCSRRPFSLAQYALEVQLCMANGSITIAWRPALDRRKQGTSPPSPRLRSRNWERQFVTVNGSWFTMRLALLQCTLDHGRQSLSDQSRFQTRDEARIFDRKPD